VSTEPIVIDPRDPAFIANPYPVFRRLRQESPVHWWDQGHMWMLSRYSDVESVLKDSRFTPDVRQWRFHQAQGRDKMPPELVEFFENGLFEVGRADHTRIRKLVTPSLSPRASAQREGMIQEVVDELLARVDGQPTFDLMPTLAEPLPIRVVSRLLGIPPEHDAEFREWGQNAVKFSFPVLPPEEQQALMQEFPAGARLLMRLVEERRANPGDDLLSSFIHAQEAGDRLTAGELVSLVGALIVAGSETTVHLLAFAVRALLRHPETLARVRADLDLLPGVVEEVLRHDNFGSLGIPRYALEPVEIRGQEIPKGDMLMLLFGAAMHDDEVFPQAERFDIDRDPSPNISFGRGAHFCLGVHLARAEVRVALRTLLTRYPDLVLDGEPTFGLHPFIRQITSLPLRVRPGANA
jgi:cytochrome P450 enzyme